jgi:hypothetical protein
MTRAPILFRVDGTRQQGWESLWRCLVCAAALQRRRRPTYFLTRLEPEELLPYIRRGGNDWIEAAFRAARTADPADTTPSIFRGAWETEAFIALLRNAIAWGVDA